VDPEEVTAVLRPRNQWEAIDLGFGMARSWWKPLWRAWLVCCLPLQVAIWVACSHNPVLALCLLWWIKPLLDRVPLLVLSRALFGATPTTREVVRALPRLWRAHPSALLWYRLDPARSLQLPVWQLEGLRGRARAARSRVLHRTVENPAVWLTLGCLCIQLAFFIGILSIAWLGAPEVPQLRVDVLLDGLDKGHAPAWSVALIAACQLIAVGVIEPLYVAGGFALYINRRNQLEGWDIEVAFRRLRRRLEARQRPRRTLGPLAGLLLALLLAAPSAFALAPGPDPHLPAASDPQVVIEEVLARPEFGGTRTETRWTLPWLEGLLETDVDREPAPSCGGGGLGSGLAGVVELLLWLAAAVLVAAGVVLVGNSIRDGAWGLHRGTSAELPNLAFGHEALPRELPPDVPGAAWDLWEQGRCAEALGVLFVAAIRHLVLVEEVRIPRAATEEDCRRAVRDSQDSELADYFDRLTRAWVQTAYGHRPPPDPEARRLCESWAQWFAEGAA